MGEGMGEGLGCEIRARGTLCFQPQFVENIFTIIILGEF